VQAARIFRALIIADAVLLLAAVAAAFVEPDLPDAVVQYLEADAGPLTTELYGATPAEGQLWAYFAAALMYVLACVASMVGLYLFKPWARMLFTAVIVVTLLMTLFMGSSIATPVMTMLDNLLYMCDGAIVAMSFSDPIRDRFMSGRSAP
jgi:hypothetical protein